ncbi:MAG: hypothetical protein KDG52_04585 [Rhodocyclaceae bacterium]|nr:hypothetical protein [Rhodocyclaceae bacterium]
MNHSLLACAILVLGAAACSKSENPPASADAGQAPPAAQATTAKAEAPAEPAAAGPAAAEQPTAEAPVSYPPNTGKLVQVMQAGGYTYGEVEGPNGQRVWVAGGHIEAQPGDMVQWGQFAVMHNFTAKSIGRTFDSILFVNSWGKVDGPRAQVAAHGAPRGGHPPMPQQGAATSAAGGQSGLVKSATTAGGYTYLEVEQGEQTTWVAAPETTVKAGDTVSWTGGMTMRNFTAKSLDRTFEQIVFAGGVTVQ